MARIDRKMIDNAKQTEYKKIRRNSSVELLKIAGIVAIMISHVVHSLISGKADYSIDIELASNNPTVIVLSVLRLLGVFGNTIFFICSAWFLIDSKGFKCKKWLSIITNAWIISIVILVISIVLGVDLNKSLLLKSAFPTILASNWYLTCYAIFYAIHPLLNLVIRNISQKQHLRIVVGLAVAYLGIAMLKSDLLFCTKLTIWIAIYFAITYLKLYSPKFINKKKTNVILCFVGGIGAVGLLLLTNYAGLHISALSDKLQHWTINNNPFILLFVFGVFNLVRRKTYTSRAVNYVAGMSLWIYLIHENIIVRSVFRPIIWAWLYENMKWGYPYPAIGLFSAGLFIASLLVSIIYSATINKVVDKLIIVTYQPIYKRLAKVENKILGIK